MKISRRLYSRKYYLMFAKLFKLNTLVNISINEFYYTLKCTCRQFDDCITPTCRNTLVRIKLYTG